MNQYALQGSQPPLPEPVFPDRCKSGNDATPRAITRGESRQMPTKQSEEGRIAPENTKEAAAQTPLKSVGSTGVELAFARRSWEFRMEVLSLSLSGERAS